MRVHSVYAWTKNLTVSRWSMWALLIQIQSKFTRFDFFPCWLRITQYNAVSKPSVRCFDVVKFSLSVFFLNRSNIEEKYLVISVKIFIIDSKWPLVSQLRCNAHAFVDQVPDWMYLWRIIIQNVRKLWTKDKKQKPQMTRQDERKKHTPNKHVKNNTIAYMSLKHSKIIPHI